MFTVSCSFDLSSVISNIILFSFLAVKIFSIHPTKSCPYLVITSYPIQTPPYWMSPWERKPSHHKTVQAKRLTSRQLSQLGLSASNWPPEEVGPTICKRVLARLLSNLRQLCSGSRINKTWKFSLCSEYPWKEANMKIGLCLWENLSNVTIWSLLY